MKAWCRAVPIMTLLFMASASHLAAQDDEERSGMGVFLDWIHKLSGPGFLGGGVSYWYGQPADGLRLRMTVALKISFNERDVANARLQNVQIDMLSFQPTLEYGLDGADVDFGTGASFDLYMGGGFRTVRNWSFPLFVQYRSRNDDQWQPRIATGIRLIPAFDSTAFAGIDNLRVERNSWEVVWQGFGGLDYVGRK